MRIKNNNDSIQDSSIGGYTNEGMGKEREKKEGSAREITPEMELGRRCR